MVENAPVRPAEKTHPRRKDILILHNDDLSKSYHAETSAEPVPRRSTRAKTTGGTLRNYEAAGEALIKKKVELKKKNKVDHDLDLAPTNAFAPDNSKTTRRKKVCYSTIMKSNILRSINGCR